MLEGLVVPLREALRPGYVLAASLDVNGFIRVWVERVHDGTTVTVDIPHDVWERGSAAEAADLAHVIRAAFDRGERHKIYLPRGEER